jgi:hypothetical protein
MHSTGILLLLVFARPRVKARQKKVADSFGTWHRTRRTMVIKSMTIQVKAAHIIKGKGSSSDMDEEPHENTSNNNINSNGDKEERPKRGRSAYNYFFRAERAKLLGISETDLEAQQHQKRKHRKTPGMIGFASLASSVGGRWKKLSETEKLPYQLKSQEDRERYQRDLEDWRRKHGLLSASHSNTDDAAAGSSVASSSSSREQAPSSSCSSQEHARKTSSLSLPASKLRRQHDAQILVHETRMKAAASELSTSSSTKYPSSISIEVQRKETRRRTSDKQEFRLRRVEEPAFEPISVKDLQISSFKQVPTRRTIRNHKEVVLDKPFEPISFKDIRKTTSSHHKISARHTPPVLSPELFEPVSWRHRSYRTLPATESSFEPVPIRDIAALEHRHNSRFDETRHDHAHAHDRGLQELSTLKEWNVLLQTLRK